MEGIPISVYKVVLSPSLTLKKIFLNNPCCHGRCKHQSITPTTVLLPDVKYKYLKVSVESLYKGILPCSLLEKKNVLEVMKILGMNRSIQYTTFAENYEGCNIWDGYILK